MGMVSNYYLLFKTAQSEFRAWKNISEEVRSVPIPIIEYTRGKKVPGTGKDVDESLWSTTPGIYKFSENVRKVDESFSICDKIFLDLTREDELSCFEIEKLSASDDGYICWAKFVQERASALNGVIPILQINPSDAEGAEKHKENIISQLSRFMNQFEGVAYRASVLIDRDFVYDLVVLKEYINEYIQGGKKFYVILDHEFIRPGTSIVHAARTLGIIKNIKNIVPRSTIVTLATSFPRVIDDIGDPEHDNFPIEEIFLNEQINDHIDGDIIEYGDYGSINPTRSDLKFATGWRPRIDFPTSKNRTFYYREKRVKEYVDHYISVAKNVISDPMYEDVGSCWGQRMIELAAHGRPQGKSPSFWISVRMDIHVHQQLRRLGIL